MQYHMPYMQLTLPQELQGPQARRDRPELRAPMGLMVQTAATVPLVLQARQARQGSARQARAAPLVQAAALQVLPALQVHQDREVVLQAHQEHRDLQARVVLMDLTVIMVHPARLAHQALVDLQVQQVLMATPALQAPQAQQAPMAIQDLQALRVLQVPMAIPVLQVLRVLMATPDLQD